MSAPDAGSQRQMTQACYFVQGKCNYTLMVKNCKICLETSFAAKSGDLAADPFSAIESLRRMNFADFHPSQYLLRRTETRIFRIDGNCGCGDVGKKTQDITATSIFAFKGCGHNACRPFFIDISAIFWYNAEKWG